MENIDDLIAKANKIGHEIIPDRIPVQARKKILEILKSKPTRCFQTKELNTILRDEENRTPSSGILTRLAEEGKIECVSHGLYCAISSPEKQSILEKFRLIIQKIL